jgi:hypothetical protein
VKQGARSSIRSSAVEWVLWVVYIALVVVLARAYMSADRHELYRLNREWWEGFWQWVGH